MKFNNALTAGLITLGILSSQSALAQLNDGLYIGAIAGESHQSSNIQFEKKNTPQFAKQSMNQNLTDPGLIMGYGLKFDQSFYGGIRIAATAPLSNQNIQFQTSYENILGQKTTSQATLKVSPKFRVDPVLVFGWMPQQDWLIYGLAGASFYDQTIKVSTQDGTAPNYEDGQFRKLSVGPTLGFGVETDLAQNINASFDCQYSHYNGFSQNVNNQSSIRTTTTVNSFSNTGCHLALSYNFGNVLSDNIPDGA